MLEALQEGLGLLAELLRLLTFDLFRLLLCLLVEVLRNLLVLLLDAVDDCRSMPKLHGEKNMHQ